MGVLNKNCKKLREIQILYRQIFINHKTESKIFEGHSSSHEWSRIILRFRLFRDFGKIFQDHFSFYFKSFPKLRKINGYNLIIKNLYETFRYDPQRINQNYLIYGQIYGH